MIFIVDNMYVNRPYSCGGGLSVCSSLIISALNLTFLILAGVLNVYNWLYFTLSLKTFNQTKMKSKERALKILKILVPILVVVILILYATSFTVVCFADTFESNIYFIMNRTIDFTSLIFFLFVGGMFLVIGEYLKRELRLWNEEVENQARYKINFAVYIISIPFIIRGLFTLFEIILKINEKLNESRLEDTMLAPIVYFLYIFITDIVPIASQLSSMLVIMDDADMSLNNSRKENEGTS